MSITFRDQGFSLIEMMVALAIAGLLSVTGVLGFRSTQESFDRMNARSFLLQDLKRAQAEAITWGCRGVFAISSDKTNYSYGCDFLPYDTSSTPTADRVFFARHLPYGITFQALSLIIFNSRGQAIDLNNQMNSVSLQLNQSDSGKTSIFAQGTLLGSGSFVYAD